MKRRPVAPCKLCKPIKLYYVEAAQDAEERAARGEEQTKCPGCGMYRWPDEMPAKGAAQ